MNKKGARQGALKRSKCMASLPSCNLPSSNPHGAEIRTSPISSIRPSPENDKLYHPITPGDPDVIALAESIKAQGLLEPIVITADNWIISGHRRYAACILAGLRLVPVRVKPITRRDNRDEFLRLLREYNRQRVKTIDEKLREEVISADPEEGYRVLIEHRKQAAAVCADTLEIREQKTRAKISEAKLPLLNAVKEVISSRRDFWPLSDRQIHYALLNNPPLLHASKPESRYRNDGPSYKSLCEFLTRARLQGLIPFHVIHDPTRPVSTWGCHGDSSHFIRKELDQFLKGYYRNLQQSQPNHIEIVGEKNTVQSVIERVASDYCIPVTIGRGFCSLEPRYHLAQRFRASGKEKLILLILSDFDPDGEEIAHSFARSLRDDFDIQNIEPVKVAITGEQVEQLQLPPMLKAKETSTNYRRFSEQHGEDAYELEAIPPEKLQEILRAAIDSVLNVDLFNQEIEQEKADAAQLNTIRRRVHRFLQEGAQ
jgi:hypothetical protein